MAVIGNAPFQGLVSGGEILDASIEGVDLSTSAIAARLGYTPVDPGAAVFSGAATISVTDNTNAALRIAQLGTGNALVVEDSANPDATPFAIDASGTVLAGFSTAPLGGYKAYINGTAFASGAWRVGDPTDGSTSGYLTNVGNTTKSISIAADPDNVSVGANSIITINIDGSEKSRFDASGRFYLGSASASAAGIKNAWALTGSTVAYGQINAGTVQSDVTSRATGYYSNLSIAANTTLDSLYHYRADIGTIVAGSTVTNQYGFYIGTGLIDATNNYGFYSAIASATGRYNFYAHGTADNYFAGKVGIGIATPEYRLDVTATDNVTTTSALAVQNSSRNYGLGIGAYTLTNRNIGGTATNIDYTFDIGGATIFNTAGIERARIDASGKLLVGTTNAVGIVTIEGTAVAPTVINALTLRNGSDGGVGLYFDNAVSNNLASIEAQVDSAGAGTDEGNLVFSTANSGVNIERMRINSAGTVTSFKGFVQPANSYWSNTYTTDSTWASAWQTVIPPGTLDPTYTYLVTFKWIFNSATSSSPYYANAAALIFPANTNATDAGLGVALATSTHVASPGIYISYRPICAAGSTTGVQIIFNGFATTGGSMVVSAVRMTYQ